MVSQTSTKQILTEFPQFLKHALQIRYRANPPKNLGERRQVLDAIQREFGDVIVFKSFCYDDSITTATNTRNKNKEARGTIRIDDQDVESSSEQKDTATRTSTTISDKADSALLIFRDVQSATRFSLKRTFSIPLKPTSSTQTKEPTQKQTRSITTTLSIHPSRLPLRTLLERSRHWGPFSIKQTLLSSYLSRVVPALGMADLDFTGPRPKSEVLSRWAWQLGKEKPVRQWGNDSTSENQMENESIVKGRQINADRSFFKGSGYTTEGHRADSRSTAANVAGNRRIPVVTRAIAQARPFRKKPKTKATTYWSSVGAVSRKASRTHRKLDLLMHTDDQRAKPSNT